MTTTILAPNDFGKLRPWCSNASIDYLKESLKRLERGTPPTPSFPLYGKRDSSLVADVRSIVEKSSSPDWLKEYEQSREVKFGPQGGTPKWDVLKDNFLLYKTALKPVSFVDAEILAEMKREYSALRASMLGVSASLDHLKKTDKIETRAAGWSTFNLKKTDIAAQQEALRYAKDGSWIHGYGYVFSRFNKQKNRIFMPMPYSSMIKQAQWFVPFLGGIQSDLLLKRKASSFTFWSDKIGFDNCFDIMESELQSSQLHDNEYLVYFSNDFEKMDTRTGSAQYESFVTPIFGAAFHQQSQDMVNAIMFTTTAPIISPSGTMEGAHGTASGAEMTNGGETICNDYFQRRLMKVMQPSGWRILSRRGNGDDSIMIFAVDKSCPFPEFEQNVRDALEQVCSETGFDAQTEKLEISDTYGKYCQNVLQYDPASGKLFWCYPIMLVLNSIVNPEKEYTPAQWDKDYRDIDIVQKLDNAVRNPAYASFVEWIMSGMKFPLLGSNEAETNRILSKYDRYRSLQSLSERYNRQDYNISKSPTVSFVLSKR